MAAAAAELVSGTDVGAAQGAAGASQGAAGSPAAVSLPALLRAARVPYAIAVREALVAHGMDDVPQNGSFVIVAASRNRAVLGGLVRWLAVSKQAVGQLVDLLEDRGYLYRSPDPADRRRTMLILTARGETAAAAINVAVRGVDDRLAAQVGAQDVATARRVLGTLAVMGRIE